MKGEINNSDAKITVPKNDFTLDMCIFQLMPTFFFFFFTGDGDSLA
jgi:hypothetical protein